MSKKIDQVVIDFPNLSALKTAQKTTITARMPETVLELRANQLDVLQQAYDGKLDIALRKRCPVITLDVMARTVADLTGPAGQLAKQIRAHTGFEVQVAAH